VVWEGGAVRLLPIPISIHEEKSLFEHKMFDNYAFDDIPLNRDIYIVDDAYLREYEESMLRLFAGGEYEYVGYVSYVAARVVKKMASPSTP
jgi:hypothetical protein